MRTELKRYETIVTAVVSTDAPDVRTALEMSRSIAELGGLRVLDARAHADGDHGEIASLSFAEEVPK